MTKIILKNINKNFENNHIIKDINLEINPREFVVFVGPSGSGKSTLLRMIAGLEEITSGELIIDNKIINNKQANERNIAMVFQTYALYPHMSVFDNMGFALKIAGVSKEEINIKVKEIASILHLEKLLDRKPKQLSGGQRQRVAIGRAMVRDPKIFLFDEPLSNLDAALRVKMRIELANLHEKLNKTMIYVTHDQIEAMTLANKIVVLKDGCLEQVGTPLELYYQPVNKFVASFIGSPTMNFMDVSVISKEDNNITIKLKFNNLTIKLPIINNEIKINEDLILGIRPNKLKPSNEGIIKGQVVLVEHLGSETYLYIQYKNNSNYLIAKTDGYSTIKHDDNIELNFTLEDIYLFKSDGHALKRNFSLNK